MVFSMLVDLQSKPEGRIWPTIAIGLGESEIVESIRRVIAAVGRTQARGGKRPNGEPTLASRKIIRRGVCRGGLVGLGVR
jgi:hypothetical protein